MPLALTAANRLGAFAAVACLAGRDLIALLRFKDLCLRPEVSSQVLKHAPVRFRSRTLGEIKAVAGAFAKSL